MTPSIADLIDELSALLEKATPGPWRGVPADDYVIEADGYPHKYGGRFQEDDTGFYLAIFGNRPKDFGEANRDIAVAAVNALPALIRELIAAHETIGRYREALRPFAEAMEGHGDIDLKRDRLDGHVWEHPIAMDVTLGDFAIARKALETEGAER